MVRQTGGRSPAIRIEIRGDSTVTAEVPGARATSPESRRNEEISETKDSKRPADEYRVALHSAATKAQSEAASSKDASDEHTGGGLKVGPAKTSLLRGSEVAPATAVTEADAHKAADAVTAHWSEQAAAVQFAPAFSSLPEEVQESVNQKDRDSAKGIFHPDSNTIWVILDRHADRADVEETLYQPEILQYVRLVYRAVPEI